MRQEPSLYRWGNWVLERLRFLACKWQSWDSITGDLILKVMFLTTINTASNIQRFYKCLPSLDYLLQSWSRSLNKFPTIRLHVGTIPHSGPGGSGILIQTFYAPQTWFTWKRGKIQCGSGEHGLWSQPVYGSEAHFASEQLNGPCRG